MDEEFYKPWAILILLSIMIKVAIAAGKLTARPHGACPITAQSFDPAGAFRSVHPCAHLASADRDIPLAALGGEF